MKLLLAVAALGLVFLSQPLVIDLETDRYFPIAVWPDALWTPDALSGRSDP